MRAWLAQEAQDLISRYPEFAPVFDRVFSRELDADAALPAPPGTQVVMAGG